MSNDNINLEDYTIEEPVELLEDAEDVEQKAKSIFKESDHTLQLEKEDREEEDKVELTSFDSPILAVKSGRKVDTPEEEEQLRWHDIKNAHLRRKILTGILGGIERTDTGKDVAVVYYNDYRVIIPTSEMMIMLDSTLYGRIDNPKQQESRILNSMLGCDVDFVIKGIENKTRAIVASRKDAMLRKRRAFYLNKTDNDRARVCEGQIIQARVIASAPKAIRIEAFGVECPITARNISWEWFSNASQKYNVGEVILIRINEILGEDAENLEIRADIKSLTVDPTIERLQHCKVQGKYAGTITDISKGVVFIHLSMGVNAIAHSCVDVRRPGVGDHVSFVVTHIDDEQHAAIGIITRILRQSI